MPYPVAVLRQLQEILRNVLYFRQLMLLSPDPNLIEVPAFVDGVEVDKRFGSLPWRLVPDLSEHANVDSAHQLLAYDVETMSCKTL